MTRALLISGLLIVGLYLMTRGAHRLDPRRTWTGLTLAALAGAFAYLIHGPP